MKRSSLPAALVILLVLLTSDLNAASTVRGKLYREAGGRSYPASGLMLRLVHPKGAVRTTYSASDGMFYFYNVAAGAYTLEVHITQKQVQKYSIRVEERQYTDIAPIRVP